MNQTQKEIISSGLTLAIISLTLFICNRFIPSILWAGVIVIATYPLYNKWQKWFPKNHTLSAFLFTLTTSLFIIIPLSWLITLLITEIQLFINYLQKINSEGMDAPKIFNEIPWLGNELTKYWNSYVAEPGAVRESIKNLHVTLAPASYFIKQIGIHIAHKSFQVSFTILTLFFFYRDNEILLEQINKIGEYCLGARWHRYATRLPRALRSTVNGTIFVGLGVGILMGLCYSLVDFPAPTLTGFITAFASMIPFFVPIVFVIIALILISKGLIINSIIVLVWGTIVMFVADHFVKPVMIGGAIRLPFLAVLFGILGGMETLGLMGLFFGPIIMVLFITLWQEPLKKL